ncbi:MAG TPA: isochorismatase family cysteine hydrolase [Spirochaetota bacterium]|nr:isochorismatase family cysteine hydrolase [Spirochaetota bacterium]
MHGSRTALVVVDMQNYYLDPAADFTRYFESLSPGCMSYISRRCRDVVVPNIVRLIRFFRDREREIIYLGLCGTDPERKDLHRFFRESWLKGGEAGFPDIYPLAHHPMAAVIDELHPAPGDDFITKTTFSAFSSTDIEARLKRRGIGELVFTGLATSQCVETTARDASDRGFRVVQIEDAQADYDEATHGASLFSSQGVCGGIIMTADEYLATR